MTVLTLKRKVSVPFPSLVTGTGGIKVVKSNGIWTSAGLSPGSGLSPPRRCPTRRKTNLDLGPGHGEYNVLTLAGLGDALYKLTSTTSLAIGTGLKTFVTQANKDIGVGSFVLVTSDAWPDKLYARTSDELRRGAATSS
jgi:hypothetical protein